MSLFSKKDEEPKVNISELRKYLVKASKARFLDWEPVGEEVKNPYGGSYRGYKTKLPSGSSIEIVVRSIDGEMVLGLRVESEKKGLFLTENPKKLSGKEVAKQTDLVLIVSWVNAIVKDNTLIGTIEGELASLIYSK